VRDGLEVFNVILRGNLGLLGGDARGNLDHATSVVDFGRGVEPTITEGAGGKMEVMRDVTMPPVVLGAQNIGNLQ
jgi:hypothetical protein